jgi:hypothetical protein
VAAGPSKTAPGRTDKAAASSAGAKQVAAARAAVDAPPAKAARASVVKSAAAATPAARADGGTSREREVAQVAEGLKEVHEQFMSAIMPSDKDPKFTAVYKAVRRQETKPLRP